MRVQIINDELNAAVTGLLEQLLEWQERKRDEVIARSARRPEGGLPVRPTGKRVIAGLRCSNPKKCSIPPERTFCLCILHSRNKATYVIRVV